MIKSLYMMEEAILLPIEILNENIKKVTKLKLFMDQAIGLFVDQLT